MNFLTILVIFIMAQRVELTPFKLLASPDSNRIANYETLGRKLPLIHENDHEGIPQKQSSSPRCGSVLSDGAGIFYKPFEQVVSNERCVWIVAVPNATEYSVNILFLGSPTNEPGSGQELVLTGVTTVWSSRPEPLLTSVKPTSLGNLRVSNSNVMLVTFMSSNVDKTTYGFALEYKATFGEGNVTSAKSTHHLFDSRIFDFKYPIHGANYSNFELAAFVFLPKNNVNTVNQGVVGFKLTSSEPICYDYVHFYKYNSRASPSMDKWEKLIGRCGPRKYELVHDDLVLVIFTPDHEVVHPGFYLYYATCPFI